MNRADLGAARPGCYVVDEVDDQVVNRDPITQDEANRIAQQLADRNERRYAVVMVSELFSNTWVEQCMSDGCSSNMTEILIPQQPLRISAVVDLVPGQEVRLCTEHGRELRAIARHLGVSLHNPMAPRTVGGGKPGRA